MKKCGIPLCACVSLVCFGLCSPTGFAQPTDEPYTFTTLAGLAGTLGSTDGTASAARFLVPVAIAVDNAGNLYVSDNDMIRKVTALGVVTTVAGLAGNAGSADGTGSAARFWGPTGIAVDGLGNLYVTDMFNDTIRKVTPAGEVTTPAGVAGSQGAADGTGSAARFSGPRGVAVDNVGNLYVADSGNDTIRKITPAGVVSTLAGLAGYSGVADGTGAGARFYGPIAVAVDSAGIVYVSDNSTIRKVTPAGVVTTLAGQAGSLGSADGTGAVAQFGWPYGLAVDGAGNVYVADTGNQTIRQVSPAGDVTTLAGLARSSGSADGTGIGARFYEPYGVAVDNTGNLYVADTRNFTIRKGWASQTHLVPPSISLGPASQMAVPGTDVTFLVVATGTPLNYQWFWNGSLLLGQTNASLVLTNVQTTESGFYAASVSNAVGTITSMAASLRVAPLNPAEAELRAALQNGGQVHWDKYGLIALNLTIPITKDTVLDGTGHALVLDGQNQVRVFLVNSNVHLTLLNLTVANGVGDQGGGLYNAGGTVSLLHCVFRGNQAVGSYTNRLDARGGAVCSLGGSVAATNCVFATNAAIRGRLGPLPSGGPFGPPVETLALEARGGAIAIQDGVLNMAQCQFATNLASGGYYDTGWSEGGLKAGAYGGAVFVTNGATDVSGCRFDHNLAQSPESINFAGSAQGADVQGGAIHHEGAGELRLLGCFFLQNQALGGGGSRDARNGDGRGGAVSTYGNLVTDHTLFQSNACFGGEGGSFNGGHAFGGALFTTNTAALNHCLFSANWAMAGSGCYCGLGFDAGANGTAAGGAVYAQGALQIFDTTFASNWVAGRDTMLTSPSPRPGASTGGALFSSAVCVATNSTWFENRVMAQRKLTGDGSALYSLGTAAGAAICQSGNPLTLVYCTIASNAVVSVTNNTGAAIELTTNAVAHLSACLLAGNTNANLAGSVVDQGFNLSSDHSVTLTNATSRSDIDPKLGAFSDHGGPTPTLALLPGSPAIDAITSGPCPDTDQRGVPRPIGAGCDIGAFEFVPDPVMAWDSTGLFRVKEVLQPARDFQIESSTDLINWNPFATTRSDELGMLEFTDATVGSAPYRFYRAVSKP